MEKRGQHEDMKKDFAKLMKSCGVSLTRIPKTCLCMKCAERFWNEKKFVNGALWNVYKAKKEREKGINSRRLQIIEKIYKEKVYKEKKCEQLLRQVTIELNQVNLVNIIKNLERYISLLSR